MQKKFYKLRPDLMFFFLIVTSLSILSSGCKETTGKTDEKPKTVNVSEPDDHSIYINYHSFQNSDLTWGFTIFENNVPYRHYNKIPVPNSTEGFVSQKEAELVAEIFIKMIKNGEVSPKLSKISIDTLHLTIRNMN